MPHLKRRAEAHFEVPTAEQPLFVHRIGKPDEYRRERSIGQHEAAFMIFAVGEDLDQLKCNSWSHDPETRPVFELLPKIRAFWEELNSH